MDIYISQASWTDAEKLSDLIRRTLRESNLPDYPEEEIDRLCDHYSPERIRSFISCKQLFLALDKQGAATGCAALELSKGETDTAWVTTVFVDPKFQKKGLGKVLMDLIESSAISQDIKILRLGSSITAHEFYLKLGFKDICESENTISSKGIFLMQKKLA